jgi:hypothetical protein
VFENQYIGQGSFARKYKIDLFYALENQEVKKKDGELQVPKCVHSDVAKSRTHLLQWLSELHAWHSSYRAAHLGREKGDSRWERTFALQGLQGDSCFRPHTGVVIFQELLERLNPRLYAREVDS